METTLGTHTAIQNVEAETLDVEAKLTECLSENEDWINQVSRRHLEKAKQWVDPNSLYVVEVMLYGLEQNRATIRALYLETLEPMIHSLYLENPNSVMKFLASEPGAFPLDAEAFREGEPAAGSDVGDRDVVEPVERHAGRISAALGS